MSYRPHSTSSAIVLLADFVWVNYAKQVISSAHFAGGWNGDYVLLSVDVAESDLRWFRDRGVYVFQCPDLSEVIRVPKDKIQTTLYRIWMFSESFNRWEYLIYLDLDVIVKGDLSYLLTHKKIMAARDSNRNSLDWQLKGEEFVLDSRVLNQYHDLKKSYDLEGDSFNAGIMSVHSSQIGKSVFDELCEMYREYVDIFSSRLQDQPLLNFYFYHEWVKMPAQFNVFVNFSKINYYKPAEKIDAIISHFAGTKLNHKPWHPENPWYHLWKSNFDRIEEFDQCSLKWPAKTLPHQEIEKYSEELEQGWERMRKDMKNFHSKLWLLKNPSRWGIVANEHIGKLFNREV